MSHEALKTKKYWFGEEDLLEPIERDYIDSLPEKIRLGLGLHMEARVSIGKAAEIAGVPLRDFDEHRAKAKIPIRGPSD